jgi:hypothetical protein
VSTPVPVPERLYRLHPLVGAVRDVKASGDGWIDTRRRSGCAHVRVSAASRRRTMRILQALVTEALRRGYAIRTAESGCAGGLGIGIGEYTWELTISESSNRVAHELSADDKRRIERGYSPWGPRWDFVASGKLTIRIGHDGTGSGIVADRQRWRLEDRLAVVFDTLAQRTIEARQRADDEARRKAERQRLWETAMERARAEFAHHRRVEHLLDAVERSERAARIRAFTARMRHSAHATDLVDWLAFADAHADTIDPATAGVTLHVPIDPRLSDLEPFLHGVSPYGPQGW